MVLVDLEQRPGDAVRDRADLAGHAAALDLDHRVEALGGVGDGERRGGLLDGARAAEVVVELLAVHDDGPLTRDESDASDRGLPATGPLEITEVLHLAVAPFRISGFCAACG